MSSKHWRFSVVGGEFLGGLACPGTSLVFVFQVTTQSALQDGNSRFESQRARTCIKIPRAAE